MKRSYIIVILFIFSANMFAQTPIANAGVDTLFCGYVGYLSAIPSVGIGEWSCNSEEIVIINTEDPNTEITSTVLNTNNPGLPYFELIWNETNGEDSDRDTIKLIFARIPSSQIDIIPAKCFGEMFTIAAREDSLQNYIWNFPDGMIDSLSTNVEEGIFQNFVHWENADTVHYIGLITTNSWGCQSHFNIDTIYEPFIPTFNVTISPDTCGLGRGAIIFADTLGSNRFFSADTNPYLLSNQITRLDTLHAGEHNIIAAYITANEIHSAYYLCTFGTYYCYDTITYTIESVLNLTANFSISADINLSELNSDNGTVIFVNNTVSDIEDLITIWNFGDDTSLNSSDILIEHIYTEAGCFVPYIEVYTDEIPGCHDHKTYDYCILIDPAIDTATIYNCYPNPASDHFNVQLPYNGTVNLEVFNSLGNIVLEITDYTGGGIPTNDLQAGIYSIRITCNEEEFYTTIFIQ